MRSDWAGLPAGARDAVLERTGPVSVVEDVPHGITCSFATVLSSANGRVFVKGVPVGDDRGRAGQGWEVAVNGAVTAVSPHLLWHLEVGGWDLLGFEWVPGRHADLSPGSLDLPLVAAALDAAQGVVAPAGVPQFVDRDLAGFVTGGGAGAAAG